MYRDGNFQSLRWNMLEASHKAHWEKLSSVYGLEEPEKLLKSEAQKKDMPVLDQLAELCICSCQNYLFSLTPVKDVSNVFNDVLTAPDDLPRRIRRDMPHHFELALRDHLIVTFAYRFCCDNLEPRSFDDYVNTLFDYIAEFDKTANPIDLAEIRKIYRRDFRKDFRNKYRNFCEQFTLTTSESGGECSNNPQAGPADNPSENTTCKGKEKQATVLDAFTNLHWRDIKEPLDLSSKISKKLDMNSIAPPDAWFLLFCASRKVKYISALRSSSENYDKISNLFRPISEQRGSLDIHKYDIVSALFPVEDCDQAFNTMPKEARSSCIWIYPVTKSNVSFAGIPIDKKDCLASPLPDQEYYLKDYTDNKSETVSKKITISTDMQLVFNAYLLERNFHIFTIACAERIHQLRLNSDTYFPEWTACLLSPLRLRAPLLHAEFLNYLIDRPAVMERRSILNCYFAQWNRIGLPVLEEYFLHLVKVYFNNIRDIFAAIEDSFSRKLGGKSRYERLIKIKLLQSTAEATTVQKEFSSQKQSKSADEMRKNIIMDTFMISNGLEFRTDWSSNLLSNWQSYNDTPIAFDVPLCHCSSVLTDNNSHYPSLIGGPNLI